jgi:molybdopterin synthase sulfur carrier subunit
LKIKAKFHLTFRELFQENERDIELKDRASIRDLLELLGDSGKCHQRIFDESGELRPNVTILKNGNPIHSLGGLQTQLEDGDNIAIFPRMTGG